MLFFLQALDFPLLYIFKKKKKKSLSYNSSDFEAILTFYKLYKSW